MIALLTIAFTALFVFALIILFAITFNLIFMLVLALFVRFRETFGRTAHTHTSKPILSPSELPNVTVQLPMYNERYVSARVIDAAARLDWPADKFQIQVLDDSTDDTKEIVSERVRYWRERGVNIELLHRTNRTGFKAGALSEGIERASGEFIAVFDADFLPQSDFLHKMIPSLARDPKAAFAQARWDHLNIHDSWLTRIEAVALDGHFAIEQQARFRGGFAFNFNGTAGIWRKSAIEDAGGWQATTLTEDLDLSYRTWLKGWHGLYFDDVCVPAELPPTMPAFLRQQARWSQGSVECAMNLLPDIWRSNAHLTSKLEASAHLLGGLFNPLMTTLLILYPIFLLLIGSDYDMNRVFNLFGLMGPLAFAPTVFFILGQLLCRRDARSVASVLLYQVVSVGMAMNTMRAALKAFTRQGGEFLRTPKWGDEKPRNSSYKPKWDMGLTLNIVWAIFAACLIVIAAAHKHQFIMLYSLLSLIGTLFIIWQSIIPELDRFFHKPTPVSSGMAGD